MKGERRRRAMALPWILGLAVILLIMGFSGSFQVSSVRRAMERIHARRLIEWSTASAFEEVAAQLERTLPRVPPPLHAVERNLGTYLSQPASLVPTLARLDFAPEGVELSPVSIRTSPWQHKQGHGPDGSLWAREAGILELGVAAKVRVGSSRISSKIMVRRYVYTTPDETRQKLQVRIQSNNLVVEVTE